MMHWPLIHGLAASAGVQLRAKETEISAALCALRLGKRLYFLPARRYASTGNSDRNVSVRLSVTRRYCVKTKKASGMIL